MSIEATGSIMRHPDGGFGAVFMKEGIPLFLRMEPLTEKTSQCWHRFKEMTCWVANQDSRGVLSGYVSCAGKARYPAYGEGVREVTGFTAEEYASFTEEALLLKEKTENKIVALLNANSVGSNHMSTAARPGNYIVYVSRNPQFSIEEADRTCQERTLKHFIQSYGDILITVGSDFSSKESFHNRGIARNPWWVFKEKYSGLSMVLLGFTAAVAASFFPEKNWFQVKPVGSMQVIIVKNLLPEEGYLEGPEGKTDLATLKVGADDPEGSMNHIKITALLRIYRQTIRNWQQSA